MPNSTHFDIAMYAVERGHHVLITKPATKIMSHHVELLRARGEHGVSVYIEHHKLFEPAYADAGHRAMISLGGF